MNPSLHGNITTGLLLAILTTAPFAAAADDPTIVSFFIQPDGKCPDGWHEFIDARGRLLLGMKDSAHLNKSYGKAFKPAHQASHTHDYSISWRQQALSRNWTLTLRDAEAYPLWVALTKGMEPPPPYDPDPIQGTSKPAEYGYPFFQSVVCEQDQADGLIDVLPKDSVLLFNGGKCPSRAEPGLKWVPYDQAKGRFIVPLVESGTHEKTVGVPWSGLLFNLIELSHHHNADKSVAATLKKVPAMATDPYMKRTVIGNEKHPDVLYYSNTWVDASNSSLSLSTSSTIHKLKDSPIPFHTLFACRKQGADQAATPKLPLYATFFRATADCASYYRVPATMGRFLVGLPEHGLPNQAFGDPLKDGEQRKHTHAAVEYKATPFYPAVRGAGSGGKQGGAAEQQAYSWLVEPAGGNFELPYIQLSHCWPKGPDSAR